MSVIGLPWRQHGPLQISESGHFVEHEDGKQFFWLGDTAWRLPTLHPDDVRRYFETRVAQGFNVVHINATSWGIPNWEGQRPFTGEGPSWSEFEPCERYWQHVDGIFDAAEAVGIYLQLTPLWGSEADSEIGTQFFADPNRDSYRYGRFLGERYGDRPNLIWCVCGEYQKPYGDRYPAPVPETHLTRLELMAEGIRAAETFRHLMSIHPRGLLSSSEDFHGREWLDFNTVQTHKGFDYIDHLVADDWERKPTKPVLNSEGWYEGEPSMYELPSWEGMDPAWVQRFQAYWSVFFGSFGYSYGHSQVWRMRDDSGSQGTLPERSLRSEAAGQLVNLRSLMEQHARGSWTPDQRLLTGNIRGSDFGRFYGTSPNLNCAIRAEDGSWAMVYSTRGMNICLRTGRLKDGVARYSWYDPRTGVWGRGEGETAEHTWEEESINCGDQGSVHWFYPPGGSADVNDWVLLLKLDV